MFTDANLVARNQFTLNQQSRPRCVRLRRSQLFCFHGNGQGNNETEIRFEEKMSRETKRKIQRMSEPLIFLITNVGYESERLPIAFVLLGLIKTPDDDPQHEAAAH